MWVNAITQIYEIDFDKKKWFCFNKMKIFGTSVDNIVIFCVLFIKLINFIKTEEKQNVDVPNLTLNT